MITLTCPVCTAEFSRLTEYGDHQLECLSLADVEFGILRRW